MKRRSNQLEFVEIPRGVMPLIDKRVRQLLPALAHFDYDLYKLVASAYVQGINDACDVLAECEREGLTLQTALADRAGEWVSL